MRGGAIASWFIGPGLNLRGLFYLGGLAFLSRLSPASSPAVIHGSVILHYLYYYRSSYMALLVVTEGSLLNA